MKYVIAYGGTAVMLAVLDAVWLTFAGRLLYRPAIGSLMMDNGFRLAPAIVFYVLYILGVVIFAVSPASGRATRTGFVRKDGMWSPKPTTAGPSAWCISKTW